MVLLASRTLTTAAAPKPSPLGSTLGQDEGEGRLSLKKTDGAEHRLFVFLHVTALINTPFFTHNQKTQKEPSSKGKRRPGDGTTYIQLYEYNNDEHGQTQKEQ
jgi:hypothetical protein